MWPPRFLTFPCPVVRLPAYSFAILGTGALCTKATCPALCPGKRLFPCAASGLAPWSWSSGASPCGRRPPLQLVTRDCRRHSTPPHPLHPAHTRTGHTQLSVARSLHGNLHNLNVLAKPVGEVREPDDSSQEHSPDAWWKVAGGCGGGGGGRRGERWSGITFDHRRQPKSSLTTADTPRNCIRRRAQTQTSTHVTQQEASAAHRVGTCTAGAPRTQRPSRGPRTGCTDCVTGWRQPGSLRPHPPTPETHAHAHIALPGSHTVHTRTHANTRTRAQAHRNA